MVSPDSRPPEPIDSDVDLAEEALRREAPPGQWSVPAAVAVGGAAGAAARYAAASLWPTGAGAFPWPTLWVNVVGCAAIGVLMALVSEVWAPHHRLVRPLLGTGVLGGFTTFSTYAVDIQRLVADGHPLVGLTYLAVTLLAALAAVWIAAVTTRGLVRKLTRRSARQEVRR